MPKRMTSPKAHLDVTFDPINLKKFLLRMISENTQKVFFKICLTIFSVCVFLSCLLYVYLAMKLLKANRKWFRYIQMNKKITLPANLWWCGCAHG